MFSILIIIAIILISLYSILYQRNQSEFESKSKCYQENQYSKVKGDNDTERSLKRAYDLTNALCRIKKAGLCEASPLTIQISSTDSFFIKLDMALTVFHIHTAPYEDLDIDGSIAAGIREPTFIPRSWVKELKPELPTDFSNDSVYSDIYSQRLNKIKEFCYNSIYQDLFGEPISYFGGTIEQFFLDVTSYPYGDVKIYTSTSLKQENYQLAFQYVAFMLQEKFPEALIHATSNAIKISF